MRRYNDADLDGAYQQGFKDGFRRGAKLERLATLVEVHQDELKKLGKGLSKDLTKALAAVQKARPQ